MFTVRQQIVNSNALHGVRAPGDIRSSSAQFGAQPEPHGLRGSCAAASRSMSRQSPDCGGRMRVVAGYHRSRAPSARILPSTRSPRRPNRARRLPERPRQRRRRPVPVDLACGTERRADAQRHAQIRDSPPPGPIGNTAARRRHCWSCRSLSATQLRNYAERLISKLCETKTGRL